MLRRSPALGLVLLLACHQGEPPSAVGLDAAVSPLPPPPGETPSTGAIGDAGASASASVNIPTASSPSSAAVATTAVDAGPDPGTLPQTKDKPEASGAAFDARVAALWDAVVKDDPDRAMPFFFPVTAYEQVKAITNPASDWRRRLVAAYKRDVHALHKRVGDQAANAKLVRADVPQDRARWVEPNEESNKLGYYRVYGTRLVYELEGKERSLEVTSLISWRGEWYVVHLSGFK
jgi:hypothetical protein